MSEYWVSHKRYFCKYCNIYIADDVPSRRQHEGGLRHKGNVERFVRGLYKEGEKRKQDREEERRDMVRIDQAAQAAYARDVGAGLVKPGGSGVPAASTSSAAPKPAPKPSNPYANYSTAESLGFTDPDAERLQAEAERRRMQGVAGDWEFVAASESAGTVQEGYVAPVAEDGGRKREAEQPVDEEDTRHFKLRRRTAGVGLGELYDPGVIPIKVKKIEELVEAPTQVLAEGAQNSAEKPKWSARGWNRPGATTAAPGEDRVAGEQDAASSEVKVEEDHLQATQEEEEEPASVAVSTVKEELPADVKPEAGAVEPETGIADAVPLPSGGGLFRKRKLPAGRGRRP